MYSLTYFYLQLLISRVSISRTLAKISESTLHSSNLGRVNSPVYQFFANVNPENTVKFDCGIPKPFIDFHKLD